MSKPGKKQENLSIDTVNVKVLTGATKDMVYLYINDVMVAGPVKIQEDSVICSFNTKVLDLPRLK